MTTIDVTDAALGQLAYHVASAAHLADGEQPADSVPHAVLSWALLQALGGGRLEAVTDELDLPDHPASLRSASGRTTRRRAEELALQLCAHFTSEGRHELAQLYQDAWSQLADE